MGDLFLRHTEMSWEIGDRLKPVERKPKQPLDEVALKNAILETRSSLVLLLSPDGELSFSKEQCAWEIIRKFALNQQESWRRKIMFRLREELSEYPELQEAVDNVRAFG